VGTGVGITVIEDVDLANDGKFASNAHGVAMKLLCEGSRNSVQRKMGGHRRTKMGVQ